MNENPDSITAVDYLENQIKLEQDARDIMPYDPNHCTHHDESMRQQIFACLTCRKKNNQDNGVCYSCSIQCHSNHELVELFARRGFTCDCGTTRMKSFGGCNLRKNFDKLDAPEDNNAYNHNFSGRFCSCNELYDASKEQGIMFQCLLGDVCNEDWYHEECILGVKRGGVIRQKEKVKLEDVKIKYPQGVNMYDSLESAESAGVKAPDEIKEEKEKEKEESVKKEQEDDSVNVEEGGEDEEDEEDDNITLEGLPNQDEIAAFICWKCVNKHSILAKWGREWRELVHEPIIRGSFDSIEEREKMLRKEPERKDQKDESGQEEQSNKRALEDNNENEQVSKRIKLEEEISLFLKPGFYELIKESKDREVISFTEKFPFLLEEEEVYEPPQDDDANSSLLDAGTRALNSIPRDQAINGMQAYSMIRERLTMFLRPFAEQGKVVTKTDVTEFFNEVKNEK